MIASFLAAARALGPVALSFLYAASGGYGVPLLGLIVLLLLAGAVLRSAGQSGLAMRHRRSGPASFSPQFRLLERNQALPLHGACYHEWTEYPTDRHTG